MKSFERYNLSQLKSIRVPLQGLFHLKYSEAEIGGLSQGFESSFIQKLLPLKRI